MIEAETIPFYGFWTVTSTYPATGLDRWVIEIAGTPGQDGRKPLPANGPVEWGFRGDAWTMTVLTYWQIGGLAPAPSKASKTFVHDVGLVVDLVTPGGGDLVPIPQLHLRCVLQDLNPIAEGDPYDFGIPEASWMLPHPAT